MASSKLMVASNSRKSDLPRRSSSSTKSQLSSDRTKRNSTMTVDGLLRTVYDASPAAESTLLDAQITLIDTIPIASTTTTSVVVNGGGEISNTSSVPKTVDEVWREIVSGDRNEMKEEASGQITLEDFLAKTGALVAPAEDDGVKVEPTERISGGVFAFERMQPASPFQVLDKVEDSIIGFGNGIEAIGEGGGGRRKRGRAVLEPLDKAAQQRQRRMIKNRESAARSRERKQAYQVELESLAVKLEEENEQLLKEKEERTKGRFKQLMEKVVPVEEKRKPVRVLRRVRSLQW